MEDKYSTKERFQFIQSRFRKIFSLEEQETVEGIIFYFKEACLMDEILFKEFVKLIIKEKSKRKTDEAKCGSEKIAIDLSGNGNDLALEAEKY